MIVTEFPRPVREIEHLVIPLSDGTGLAARIFLPADAEAHPVPAILEYLPYRKRDGTWERDALTHPYLAGHGYAAVRVDIRGSGESEGLLDDEYSARELADGVEVIAWLAAQSWCDGAVGMMGISWGGFNALQIAALRPPALRAIITICSTDDRYRDDVHFMGGAVLTAKVGWASFLFGAMCHPPDPALLGESWRAAWLARLAHLPFFLANWFGHQRRDAYWKHGSVCEDYAAIACPVYALGGWTDGYTNAIPRLLASLSVPRKGLIGPWAHAYPHFAKPGPAIGFLQEALRWWDHWLKGIETGVMDEPMLRAWMMESVRPARQHEERAGRWVAETAWPPPSVRTHHLALADGGALSDGGRLAEAGAPADLAPIAFCSPADLGAAGGSWCPFGRGPDDAGDQRADDARSVCFETGPLVERLEILGAPVITLTLAADRPLANLAVRLCDVHPDGASLRVSFGILNLAHRDSHEAPSPLEPGRRYHVRLALNDVGFAFPAGHRIRLALSTAYWPMVWPAPERATLTLYGGGLELPLRTPQPADEALAPLPPPETAPPAPRETITRDGQRLTRIAAVGIALGAESRLDCHLDDPDDPLSARIETERSAIVARDEWSVRVVTQTTMRAEKDAFLLSATMRAYEAGEEVSARAWDCRIPRDLV